MGRDISPRRALAGLSLAALSAITGVISYQHGLDVARWVGNTGLVAFLVPLVPDLMIVTSSLTLMEAAAIRARRPWLAMVSLAAGIGWTIAMNVAAGWHNGTGGALVAGGIPLAFVLTFESLLWLNRRGRDGVPGDAAPAADGQAVAMNLADAIKAASPFMSEPELAAAFKTSRATVRRKTGRLASNGQSGRKASKNAAPAAGPTAVPPTAMTPPGQPEDAPSAVGAPVGNAAANGRSPQ